MKFIYIVKLIFTSFAKKKTNTRKNLYSQTCMSSLKVRTNKHNNLKRVRMKCFIYFLPI